jgi:hypothetical protein
MSVEIELLASHEAKLQLVRLRAESATEIFTDRISSSTSAAMRQLILQESIADARQIVAASIPP